MKKIVKQITYCPECGGKISPSALSCPHCGYYAQSKPIGIKTIPVFKINTKESNFIIPFNFEQNKMLNEYFGNAKNLVTIAPSLIEAIKATFPKKVKVVDIPSKIQNLIDKGKLTYTIDENGKLIAQLRNTSGQIMHHCRIKEMNIRPDMLPSLSNLAMQMVLVAVLIEVREINKKIEKLSQELQNDRLALADAALQSLEQAELIKDSNLREKFFINILNISSEAKCKLFYSFSNTKENLEKELQKNSPIKMFSQKSIDKVVYEYFRDLYKIFQSTYIELKIYCWLGEQESAKKSLIQLNNFLDSYKINKEYLLKINSEADKYWEQFEKLIKKIDSVKLKINKNTMIAKENKKLTKKERRM